MSSDQHFLLCVLYYSQLCRRAAESEESLESIGLLLFPAANKPQKVRVHTCVLFRFTFTSKTKHKPNKPWILFYFAGYQFKSGENCISQVSCVEMRNLCVRRTLQCSLSAASHCRAVTWSHCQVCRMQLDSFILLHLFRIPTRARLCKLCRF